MIVRELIARFGIDFDSTGAKKANREIDSLSGKLGSIVKMVGAGAALKGVYDMVQAASGVDEAMNVVSQTFGDSTDQVLRWAKESGDVMGRSQYSMREYAGALGAVLAPTLGNKQAAAELSTTLAGLAVDLGSFFNKGDEETLERLRSGLLGSSEAVDQLGINLRVESLSAFAASQGITKSYKAMTEAEKVQLRYRKIMADTIDKQGDAARTGGGWANQLKRLTETWKDLGISVGSTVLKPFTEALKVVGRMTSSFGELVRQSSIVETALVALAGVAGLFVSAWSLANLPLLMMAGGALLVLFALEDLYRGLEKGDSYIRDWFESLMGKEGWNEVVAAWKAGKKALDDIMSGKSVADAIFDMSPYENSVGADSMAMQSQAYNRALYEVHSGVNEATRAQARAILKSGSWRNPTAGPVVTSAAAKHANQAGLWKEGFSTGPVTITINGNASPSTVRDIEAAARRLQQEQQRHLYQRSGRFNVVGAGSGVETGLE